MNLSFLSFRFSWNQSHRIPPASFGILRDSLTGCWRFSEILFISEIFELAPIVSNLLLQSHQIDATFSGIFRDFLGIRRDSLDKDAGGFFWDSQRQCKAFTGVSQEGESGSATHGAAPAAAV